MVESKQTLVSSSFLFVITFATVFFLSSLLILGAMIPANSHYDNQISSFSTKSSDISSSKSLQINFGAAFAQSSVATLASSASNTNNSLVFNNYENSEIGISIKYPSTFLIDESNSNETVKQVTFFPAYDDGSDYPQTYISWFNIYVEELYPPISDSPINFSSYLEDQANAIQEENEDVTIVETSTDAMLSGHPAYKLVTRSYSGNTSIDDIEIGTIIGNKLFILNYEVNTNDVQNSLPVANKMIYSFKINTMSLAESLKDLTNSTDFATIQEKVPILGDLLSSLSLKNLTNNPYGILNILGLNETTRSTIENFLTNSSIPSPGSMQTNFSSLLNSDLRSINPETLCSIQILSSLCKGNILSQPTFAPFSSNESSISGIGDLFNLSRDNTTVGDTRAIGEGFNLLELKSLLGPFAMSSSSSPSSSSSDSSENASGPLGDFNLSSLFSSSLPTTNTTSPNQSAALLLNQLLLNNDIVNKNTSNNNISNSGNLLTLGNGSIFNPFKALFGTNSTD